MADLQDDLRRRSAAAERAERSMLGFARRPAVRWLSPSLLARAAAEVVVSGWFGKFADKRESQRAEPQGAFEISPAAGGDGLWLDFVSDTGDGWEATATMAWLLAQPSLPGPGGEPLSRGDVLLLGGDQVYPSAGAEAYEDRFVGPFRTAFPEPPPGAPADTGPELFALPGNHDWYDGLTAFLRLFCQPGRLGGWRKRQARSYWALRLPHRWWVFGIDIQLDTYIDRGQLDYFRSLDVRPGDRVLLATAKPSWVKVEPGVPVPPSWRNLAYFEDKAIRERGAELALAVTGDLHHYARYASEDGEPVWITAGGGGAYSSPTHTLPEHLELPLRERPPLAAELRERYPRAADSRGRRAGVLKLPFTNSSFGRLMASVYAIFTLALLGALNGGERGLVAEASEGGLALLLGSGTSAGTLAVAALLATALAVHADLPGALAKAFGGIVHATAHLAIAIAIVAALARVFSPAAHGAWLWLAAVPAAALAGYVLGSLVFALVLLLVHLARGAAAPRAANEVFASQGITDWKHLLRMRLGPDGRLTVFALGVDRICRRWDLMPQPGGGFRLSPRDAPPRARPVDEPVVLAPAAP